MFVSSIAREALRDERIFNTVELVLRAWVFIGLSAGSVGQMRVGGFGVHVKISVIAAFSLHLFS